VLEDFCLSVSIHESHRDFYYHPKIFSVFSTEIAQYSQFLNYFFHMVLLNGKSAHCLSSPRLSAFFWKNFDFLGRLCTGKKIQGLACISAFNTKTESLSHTYNSFENFSEQENLKFSVYVIRDTLPHCSKYVNKCYNRGLISEARQITLENLTDLNYLWFKLHR
jgi:hypothetical protein